MSKLKREISSFGLTMVAIGSCIGSGIFLTPSQIASHLPSPFFILLVWVIGGIITLTGALTFAELGAMFPEAGGVYVYLKEAYGDLFGFLYGWAYLVIITSGAIAALSIAFAYYLNFLIPIGESGIKWVAILSIMVLTIINVLRVKAAEIFSNIFTGLKLLGILGIVFIGLILGKTKYIAEHSPSLDLPTNLMGAFGLALIGVLWSYGGWQHASFLAGEVKNPQRAVPRAMIIGSIAVGIAYICINLSYMFLLPVNQMGSSNSVAADAISTVFPFGAKIIAIIIAVSVIGTAGIYTLSAPRLYYAMGRDGLFFKGLAKVHHRFHTPINAILIQSSWAIILLLFWGTFENVITYVVFTDWMFFGLTAFSIFIFRIKQKDRNRPYKTPLYPLTPIIFITVAFLFVGNTLIEKPLQAWAGLIFLVLGVKLYYIFRYVKKNKNTKV